MSIASSPRQVTLHPPGGRRRTSGCKARNGVLIIWTRDAHAMIESPWHKPNDERERR